MSIITVVGAGMMGSAMSFPARDNGHEVRLVGIHNRENIESIRRNGYHPTLKRTLPEGVKAYHLDQLEEAMKDADLILCGVSSFGMEWFEENIVPIVPEGIPVLSITKGLEKDAAGNLTPFPEAIMRRAAEVTAAAAACLPSPLVSLLLAVETAIIYSAADDYLPLIQTYPCLFISPRSAKPTVLNAGIPVCYKPAAPGYDAMLVFL